MGSGGGSNTSPHTHTPRITRFVEKDPFETASGNSRKIKKDFDKDVSRFTPSKL